MAQPLPADFAAFLKLLHANRVKYLLIGGYAVGHYGYVRTTADMDIWIETSSVNAHRVARALQEFGFGAQQVDPLLFLKPENIVRMGVPPLRLEIAMQIDGVTFEECYSRRQRVRFGRLLVNVIDLHDLLKNKKVSARDKDLLDIKELRIVMRKKRKRH
ncbi:MAG: hypothetical protein JNJ77_15090 [Planctomycetia bacterium]|nr:hypothetical protein [Planctomycetia bacterium]